MPSFEPDSIGPRGRRELILPLVFLFLSGFLVVLPAPVQQQVSSALRSSVLAPFIWVQESLQRARLHASEVAELQARLDTLVTTLAARSTLFEENRRLRSLLDLRERGDGGFLPASAVRPGTRGSESMFLLDVGSAHGVTVNDPVVVAEGLVGVIREVTSGSALAMEWTHPDFRVSVMTAGGEAFGLVEPRRGAFREEDRLLLGGVPYHTPLPEGIAVVTSGRGSVYPRGILVGRVGPLAGTEAGWQRSYWLDPAVPPGSATHVLVLTGGMRDPEEGFDSLWRREAPITHESGEGGPL